MRAPARPLRVLALVLALALAPALVSAHSERHVASPARPGAVPDPDRAPTEVLDVCKTGECAFADIQAAVDAAQDGALIRIWPGLYEEHPSRAAPDVAAPCGEHEYGCDGAFRFEDHLAYPNAQSLIAILGKKDITLRGMGDEMSDVVIDAAFQKHVVVRADRADGIVVQNLQVWHGVDHGLYVIDTDGAWFDHVGGYYSGSYQLFFYATDHGYMGDCEGVGGGDSGIYVGGSPNTPGRFSTEITRCRSHHNLLGYSGTQGNHVWVHHNVFDHNAVGLVSDSETDHPNYPQQSSVMEHNLFLENNYNVYDAQCGDDDGCSEMRPNLVEGIIFPVGTGIFFPSVNANLVRHNTFVGHDRTALWLASGQGLVIGPTSEPAAPPFASTGNRFVGNVLDGNAIDFSWDGMGRDNCWQDNVRTDGGAVTTDGAVLPPCDVAGLDLPASASSPNPANMLSQLGLLVVDGPEGPHPICHYAKMSPCTGGEYTPDQWPVGRNRPGGYVPPPTPPTCGPSDDATCWA